MCLISVSERHVSLATICIIAVKIEDVFTFSFESEIEGHLFDYRAVVTFAR